MDDVLGTTVDDNVRTVFGVLPMPDFKFSAPDFKFFVPVFKLDKPISESSARSPISNSR